VRNYTCEKLHLQIIAKGLLCHSVCKLLTIRSDIFFRCIILNNGIAGFNDPLNTSQDNFVGDFMGQMAQ